MPEPHFVQRRPRVPAGGRVRLWLALAANAIAFLLAALALLGLIGWELGMIALSYLAAFCLWATPALLQASPAGPAGAPAGAGAHPALRQTQARKAEIDARKAVQANLQRRVDRLYRSVAEQADHNAMIAHELSTPLSVIDLAAQGLASSDLARSAGASGRIQRIQRAVARMRTLAAGLHSCTAQAGSTAPESQPVALRELVRHVLENHGASTRLRVDMPGEIVLAADASLLEILLSNLVANACKYAPEGPIELSVWREAGMACIDVADRGPGLLEAELERIFERGYRGRSAGGTPGTGLGLFVARRIAQSHGGSLRARNRAQGGSRFMLRLPAGHTEQAPADA